MKRDPRLHGLSSEHHHALVLARTCAARAGAWTQADGTELAARFEAELEPHFRTEEEVLLPALREACAEALAEQLEREHAVLRSLLRAAQAGDGPAATELATRLSEHVRFEERELFPACEARLPSHVLDEVARRAPKAT